MLELERRNDEVFYNGTKLKINAQASKGPGNEVVYIKDCPEANGQTWLSLSRLEEGMNMIECKPRVATVAGALTPEERERIAELQAEIDAIKAAAKARQSTKPNFKIDISKLSAEEKQAEIDKIKAYLATIEMSK